MIHDVGVELQAALVALGCPLKVVDREARKPAGTVGPERIVIEFDGSDSFSASRSQHRNPEHRFTRSVGAKLTIYAVSSRAGAAEFEHTRKAEHALDLVLVALDNVARTRRVAWTPTGGGFVQPEDLEGSERRGGAVYELTFTIDRAVTVRTWTGDAAEEVTVGTDVEIVNEAPTVALNGA